MKLPGQGRPQLWEDSEANEDESHGKGRRDRPQDGTVPSGPGQSYDWSESGNSQVPHMMSGLHGWLGLHEGDPGLCPCE